MNFTKTYSKTTTLFLLGRSQVDSISNHDSVFVAKKFSNAFCSWGAFSTNTWKYKKKKKMNCPRNFPKRCPRNCPQNCSQNCLQVVPEIAPEIVSEIIPTLSLKLFPKLSPKLTTKLSTDFVRQNCPWNCSRNYPKNCHKNCPKLIPKIISTFVVEKFNNVLCYWGAFSTNTKVIYTKYSKHWLYTVAHTIEFFVQ